MLARQRNLVHSPFLKTRSPGGRSWQYKGLRSGVRYPLLERIEEEGEGGTEQVVEALEGGPTWRSREKTVQFMNGWRRLGSRRREKPEENLFTRRGTYTGAGLAQALYQATIRMWDCMLGTSNMEPEERASALTAAVISLVTSCSAIKPDVVTKAVYAAGTGAVQVQPFVGDIKVLLDLLVSDKFAYEFFIKNGMITKEKKTVTMTTPEGLEIEEEIEEEVVNIELCMGTEVVVRGLRTTLWPKVCKCKECEEEKAGAEKEEEQRREKTDSLAEEEEGWEGEEEWDDADKATEQKATKKNA
uniref:Uncharacterized protein n=1 Tax=Chromera velia CCMP2878 TaxID=1169474 RepID=A0A0G4H9W6_9ALVE|eukprot:Cvel_6027.t1-p1 / transcript=Cvel_6027.t1 / gene=Cvel_6027 / organism=Chromera_velia_CCMP2878 / gene_product=hypothetical protein / transcript_product=hypothetical protein / location=Cvel_scaffold289:21657-23936(-) / protein_length=300 / sequence_SO=supercontig / SO=protein_coding / is_pseudo=false